MRNIVFVGNGRCYHTMDWYRTVRRLCPDLAVPLATDLIDSEGHKVLVSSEDDILPLVNIDRLLFRGQSRLGNLWRNLVKLLFFPVQVSRLKQLARNYPDAIFHAHTMYYMFLCWRAGLPFVGTPQGSEILVRPDRSRLYRYFAVRSLRAARAVTVDSAAMQLRVASMSGVDARVMQNGVDVPALQAHAHLARPREKVLSIRGMTALYRIHDLLAARAQCCPDLGITFIYPFWDERYKASLSAQFIAADADLGRLDRAQMCELLGETLLTVSIPSSDSSPRSVYEAIFAGAAVAATHAAWFDALPQCMQSRVFLVDLSDATWMAKAMEFAISCAKSPYTPSAEAVSRYDQENSMRKFVRDFYDCAPSR